MKLYFLLLASFVSISMIAQRLVSTHTTYQSGKYFYTIEIPMSFTKGTPKQKNTDLLFQDSYGSSINSNVTDRLPQEYNITAHYYNDGMLERDMKSIFPNFNITYSEKTYVAGEKAFIYEYTGSHPSLKGINCTFFKGNKVYVITCSAEKSSFNNYKPLFMKSIKSIKFK
ncbi:MAG: hypothetical protein RID18_16305 [Cytophagales bacterium]